MKKNSSHTPEAIQKMKDSKAAKRDLVGKRDAVSLEILQEIDKLSLAQTIEELPEVAYKAIYAAIKVLLEKSLCSSEYTIRTRSATYLIDKLSDEKFLRAIDAMRGKGAKVAAGKVEWGEPEKASGGKKKRGRKPEE